MNKEDDGSIFMFKPVPYLGKPRAVAPERTGFISATVQFVVPELAIGKDHDSFLSISEYCGIEVENAAHEIGLNNRNGRKVTLVSLAFYVPKLEEEEKADQSIQNKARLLMERFVGILSFYAGIKCSAVAAQTSVVQEGGRLATRLEASKRAETPEVHLDLPERPFDGRTPSDEIFSALFWLRRGLAARDPLETYASLVVSLQSIAREVVSLPSVMTSCPKCGAESDKIAPSLTGKVRALVVEKLGASEDLFKRVWKARNSIVAHGNKTITADTFLELTELKFDVAELCFAGIKLAMNLPTDRGPAPHEIFFNTSAMMYLD